MVPINQITKIQTIANRDTCTINLQGLIYLCFLPAPRNAEDFKSVGQNETSVTLQWKKVENILTYVLVSSDGLETNVTAEIANEPVTHVTSGLTNGTKYNFTLFTVSENVRSSGVSISAFTGKRHFLL